MRMIAILLMALLTFNCHGVVAQAQKNDKSLEINNMDYNFATPCMNPMKGPQKSPSNLFQTTKYTALGDSIAYGMSASSGDGYVSLFHSYIKGYPKYKDIELINLGTIGCDSTELLRTLENDPLTRKAVADAKIITMSVGGNNILNPVVTVVADQFGVDLASSTYTQLQNAVVKDPEKEEKIMKVVQSSTLVNQIALGVIAFTKDWSKIIEEIKQLAPQANIIVSTVYNPFDPSDEMLYKSFDLLIRTINGKILEERAKGGYYIVDVYTEFKKHINDTKSEKLVEFQPTDAKVDPHPTTAGHKVISMLYSEAFKAMEENVEEVVSTSIHFSDIPDDFWGKQYIEAVAARGLISGKGNGLFDPDGNITRAEFAKLITLAKETHDPKAETNFTDVAKDQWYYSYVASAVKAGIIKGQGNGTFAPEEIITRQDMTVMLARALGKSVPVNKEKSLNFKDKENISDYAKDAVAFAVENQLIAGKAGNRMDPLGIATRAEAATLIYRLLKL